MVLQDLDISARFLPVIRAFLWDFIGCSALANSKREDMSYSQARARVRALCGVRMRASLAGAAAAAGPGVLAPFCSALSDNPRHCSRNMGSAEEVGSRGESEFGPRGQSCR